MQPRRSSSGSGYRSLLAASIMIALSGCEGTPAPPAPDHDAAKQTLERALASWQNGESIEVLAKASPSIGVSDSRWENGEKLTKFELQGPGQPKGGQRAFRVALWLTDGKGKPRRETVEYRVTTEPTGTVTRLIFD